MSQEKSSRADRCMRKLESRTLKQAIAELIYPWKAWSLSLRFVIFCYHIKSPVLILHFLIP